MAMNINYSKLASQYAISQKQMPVDEALLLKAAGADHIISQAEASQFLGDVTLTNNQTQTTLSLAEAMRMNGFNGITLDLAAPPPAGTTVSLDATAAAPPVLNKNKPVPLATVAAGFDTTQNGKPIDPAVLTKAAGADGILSVEEATQLKGVLCTNKQTGEVLPIAECMAKNGVGAIDINAKAVPLATVAAGFDTTQDGKPIDPAVLAKAAGADGILTQEEAAASPDLKNVLCTNKKTGEVLPIAECMTKNGVPSINLNADAKLAPVPLATVAAGFDTTQNGKPIDPAVLAKAAGADGVLTITEASTLQDVLCTNKKTGEILPIAECMAKNGVASIQLSADAAKGGAGAADGGVVAGNKACDGGGVAAGADATAAASVVPALGGVTALTPGNTNVATLLQMIIQQLQVLLTSLTK
jgi:hypothetical protein